MANKPTVAVVGVSTMGQQVGSEFLLRGYSVIMVGRENSKDPLGAMQSYTARRAPPAIFEQFRFVRNINLLPPNVEVVIEAVSERLSAKLMVLSQIEEAVSASCVIATNTSSIDPETLRIIIKNKSRFIGLHFFNPTWAMRFVEVAPFYETSPQVIEQVGSLCIDLQMDYQIVQATAGFVVNRLIAVLVKEAKLINRDHGVSEEIIDKCCKAILRCEPFAIEQLVTPELMAIMLSNLDAEKSKCEFCQLE